jgi:hypothetical protein
VPDQVNVIHLFRPETRLDREQVKCQGIQVFIVTSNPVGYDRVRREIAPICTEVAALLAAIVGRAPRTCHAAEPPDVAGGGWCPSDTPFSGFNGTGRLAPGALRALVRCSHPPLWAQTKQMFHYYYAPFCEA